MAVPFKAGHSGAAQLIERFGARWVNRLAFTFVMMFAVALYYEHFSVEITMEQLEVHEALRQELLDTVHNLTVERTKAQLKLREAQELAESGAGLNVGIGHKLNDVVDKVYVLNLNTCPTRWGRLVAWAKPRGIELQRFAATQQQDMDILRPPKDLAIELEADSITSGQVACTRTHQRVWKDVVAGKHRRVLVLEDDVYLTDDLLTNMAHIFQSIEDESTRRHTPWHITYLRRYAIAPINDEKVWSSTNLDYNVTVAGPSWGNAAYVLSYQGAKYLLEHVRTYRAALDVQVSDLQRDRGAEFITLSACNNINFQQLCPENIVELPLSEQGECDGSTVMLGASFSRAEYEQLTQSMRQAAANAQDKPK